jgi:hypothetical protein
VSAVTVLMNSVFNRADSSSLLSRPVGSVTTLGCVCFESEPLHYFF